LRCTIYVIFKGETWNTEVWMKNVMEGDQTET